jgi:hypothetical protein
MKGQGGVSRVNLTGLRDRLLYQRPSIQGLVALCHSVFPGDSEVETRGYAKLFGDARAARVVGGVSLILSSY